MSTTEGTELMEDSMRADVAVLGGGSGGYAAAIRTAQLGGSVVLVEADAVGGTCLHRGCVPTKALLRVGEVADTARDGARYGLRTTLDEIAMTGVHAFKDATVERFHKGLTALLRSSGVTVVDGYGRLTAPDRIAVGEREITADAIVIATGSAARQLPGVPVGGRILTSDEALRLEVVPDRVAVLGGGVIGVEFASLWASLGSAVTIIEALPTLLPNDDPDVVKHLARAFRRRKIAARTGAAVTGVEQDSDGVTVNFETSDPLEVDYLLVAVGRRPRTEDLGLEALGIELVDGFVKTDQRLQTTVTGIYAVGDVVAGPQLAHRSFQQGVFVAEELAARQPKPIDDDMVPRVTYSHPEVAAVGLTEESARLRYGDSIRVAQQELAGNAKSHLLGSGGMVKVVTADDGRVLGVHMVGDRVGELIGEAQILCGLGISATDAADLVHAHPSQHEALGEALMAVAGRPLHGH
jgi:dihydrolipoamide dehydrogenase